MLRVLALTMALSLVGGQVLARGEGVVWRAKGVQPRLDPAERASRQLLRAKVPKRFGRALEDRVVATILQARALKLGTFLDGQRLTAPERAQARSTLRTIDQAGRSDLLPLLRRAISKQPARSSLRRALARVYGRAKKAARSDGAYAAVLSKQESVLARALLLHGRKLDTKLLPAGDTMPLLLITGPEEAFIQQKMQPWLDGGQHRKAITLKLEAWLAQLRSKNDPRATPLKDYLARYKDSEGWAARWIRGLYAGKSRSRAKPNYRIEADGFVLPKEQLALLPPPNPGFGYDGRLADVRRLFERADATPWREGPNAGEGVYSWQLLARLQRELIDLEASSADTKLQRALGAYLNIGFTGTGLPARIDVWPPIDANDRALAATVDKARRYVSAGGRDLYMALFGRALALEYTTGRGDAVADRQLATKIHSYLAQTRANLRREYQKKVPALRRRVLEAYAILRRVAPELVEKLPKLTFVVGSAFGPGLFTREDLPRRGRSIYLPADSDVKSILKNILHEITHTFEYHGPLLVLARALSFRAARGGGGELVPLSSLIEGYANQGPDQLGYRGDVSDPYALRYYADGYTEVHSVAIEKLASKEAALKLFKEDGHHLLTSLGALKNGAR